MIYKPLGKKYNAKEKSPEQKNANQPPSPFFKCYNKA